MIRAALSFPEPENHRFHVAVEVVTPDPREQRLRFATWTPGSYLIREFQRMVSRVRASVDGKPVAVERVNKCEWLVRGATGPLTVAYEVFANDLTVRTSHLDGTHAFFNPANLFMTAVGFEDGLHELTIQMPKSKPTWLVAVSEREVAPLVYRFRSFDHFVDTPFEIGEHERFAFDAAGKTHTVVMWGRNNADPEKLAGDLTKIVEVQAAMMGRDDGGEMLPHGGYLFVVHHARGGYGGLEHCDSTVLICEPDGYTAGKKYRRFLGLASHEYFHLWNVKRVKPAAFVPYDLTRENYTTLLWAFEGLTSYYDDLFLARSGVIDEASYLNLLGEAFTQMLRGAGRHVESLADSSFDTWVKYYRRHEDSANTTVSYYVKGGIVGLCLDLLIRRETGNARSLDDVMRTLWQRYGKTGVGVPEDGVEKVANEVAGKDLTPFFDVAIRGTEDLDWNVYLEVVGLQLCTRAAKGADDAGGTAGAKGEEAGDAVAWLGVALTGGEGESAPVVQSVVVNGPAERAGLTAGDEVIAWNGSKLSKGRYGAMLKAARVGDEVTLHVFRRGELCEVRVTLVEAPRNTAWLAAVENPTEAQLAARAAWLGR